MPLRPKFPRVLLSLAAAASLLILGCSSDFPYDMNYGTDVAVGFVAPDGGGRVDSGSEAGNVDSGSEAGNLAIDQAQVEDAPPDADEPSPVDGPPTEDAPLSDDAALVEGG